MSVVPGFAGCESSGTDRSPSAAAARGSGLRTVWVLLTGTQDAPAAALRATGFHETGRYTTSGATLLRFSR